MSNLKPKENHEKSSLTLSLSLSFWLHAEKNGFYLGLNYAEGSYLEGKGSIGEKASAKNALNEVKDSKKIANRFVGNGGSGGLFSEISFGYKYFLGKKRIIGFRHSLFFGYQIAGISVPGNGIIVFLPYGFNTDMLINWTNDKVSKKIPGRISRESSGLVVGMDIGASTWFSSNNLYPFSSINLNPFNQVKSRTIFQLQGKFGIRYNSDDYKIDPYGDEIYLGGSSAELGVKVPAFGVNYYSDAYGNKLDFKRLVSVYLNVTLNFKNKN
ncbi:outer membrane protein [Helicobacter pylori]|nr:outer membrane protein [Helicobacter pylori]